MENILDIIINVVVLYLIFEIEKKLEKRFIVKNISPGRNIEKIDTMFFFKIFKILIISIAAVESVFNQSILEFPMFILGIVLVISGVFLRIVAIKTLGEFWNFRVVFARNHRFVNYGVYKYLDHPGYIGNIYIVGLCLMFNSHAASIISIVCLSFFYIYRSSIENRLNRRLISKGLVITSKNRSNSLEKPYEGKRFFNIGCKT